MTEDFILERIKEFKVSNKRKQMFDGIKYYDGKHDILARKRMAIGNDGDLEEVRNLPNARIVDNQYKKMVKQKVNYMLGQPISVQTDNQDYAKLLRAIFDKRFLRLLKQIGTDCFNCGIAWLFSYYDSESNLTYKRLKPYELIPIWSDDSNDELECVIRFYKDEEDNEKIEIYDKTGIKKYTYDNKLILEEFVPYFTIANQAYNWSKIPIIAFRANAEETSLLKNIKSLQDGLNSILSQFQNNMEEDARNTILVIVNYDGQNLGEFRKNLATYGAVKVKSNGEGGGDLRSLQVEVNADNYKAIIDIFKKAIIENAMGYDAKDDRLGGNANELNIMSMYSDIDLDANDMETEYQASFEQLLWFINCHLANTNQGDYTNETVDIIFNRDILISETGVIENITKSVGLLSEKTLIAQHPWIDDPQAELESLKQQREDEANPYSEQSNE